MARIEKNHVDNVDDNPPAERQENASPARGDILWAMPAALGFGENSDHADKRRPALVAESPVHIRSICRVYPGISKSSKGLEFDFACESSHVAQTELLEKTTYFRLGSVRPGFDPLLDGLSRRLTDLMRGAPWQRMNLNNNGMASLQAAEEDFLRAIMLTYEQLRSRGDEKK